jgi:hypothetical protein
MSASVRWAGAMIDHLCQSKAEGHLSYVAAWKLAKADNPRRDRNAGMFAPTLFAVDEADDEADFEIFLHDACWAAWHRYIGPEPGQGKALARFRPSMLAAMADSSEPAVRTRRAA